MIKLHFLLFLLLICGFDVFSQEEDFENQGYVIDQSEGTKTASKGVIYKQVAVDSSNIDETFDMAIIREEFVVKIQQIKMGLMGLMMADEFDRDRAEVIATWFDELLIDFEKINDGKFDDEIAKIEFVWEDFENYLRLPDSERYEALEIIYETWEEVNIDITNAFNKKFSQDIIEK